MENRIIPHPYYIGWYIVETWNGFQYIAGPAFRSFKEAQDFIS